MNFGTKGCMYNCGDECTGECIKTKTKMSKGEILEIKKEVLIKNNIHWLHVRERAEYQVEEGRVPITDKDLFEIIEIVLKQNKDEKKD